MDRVHALEGGSGSPLLLLHGGGGVAAAWAPVLAALGERYHVVAVDRPGCGLSGSFDYRGVADYGGHASKFVERVCDALGWRTTSILANSMGGFWAFSFALGHPSRVDRLVLAGAPAGIDRWIPPFLRLLGLRGVNRLLLSTVARPTPAVMLDTFRRILVAHPERLDPDLLEVSRLAFTLPGAERAWHTMLERFLTLRGVRDECFLRDRVATLSAPTLFVWGEKDAFAPPSSGEELAARMPKAELHRVPDAGHLPWLDAPDAVVRSTRAWLS